MNSLCKYSDIFGKSRTGAHTYRLFDLAIVDLLLTLVASYFLKDYLKKSLMITFLGLWGIGILFHILFCVETPVVQFIRGFSG